MNRAALLVLRTRLTDAPGGRAQSPWLSRGDALLLLEALLGEDPECMRDPVGRRNAAARDAAPGGP